MTIITSTSILFTLSPVLFSSNNVHLPPKRKAFLTMQLLNPPILIPFLNHTFDFGIKQFQGGGLLSFSFPISDSNATKECRSRGVVRDGSSRWSIEEMSIGGTTSHDPLVVAFLALDGRAGEGTCISTWASKELQGKVMQGKNKQLSAFVDSLPKTTTCPDEANFRHGLGS